VHATEPRAPARFAASALGSPAPRFQRSGRGSKGRIDSNTREIAGFKSPGVTRLRGRSNQHERGGSGKPRRGETEKPRVEDPAIAGSGTLGARQVAAEP